MLSQFLVRYPTGSLISELLTIYQGKFVVRVSAQVEGVLRATGMAVSESLDLAEDQARSRALMVLGIDLTQNGEQSEDGEVEAPDPTPFARQSLHGDASTGKTQRQSPLTVGNPPSTLAPAQRWLHSEEAPSSPSKAVSSALFSWDEVDAPVENFGNVTPLVPRNYSEETTLDQNDDETTVEANEPIDLSDAIARTSVELKRLGWGTQQGREYLKQTYNKRSRQELTDQEMLEFLHYLESQPSQSEPFA